jgi:hypothetical protein
MGFDDDDLAEFLDRYDEACVESGVEPLSANDLAVLADAMLTRGVAGSHHLH